MAGSTTCPFCGQWNPDGARRCCFCTNRLDADEDGTVSGRPAYEREPVAMLPGIPSGSRPAAGPRRVKAGGFSIQLTMDQWIGVGIALLILIVVLSSRC